MIDEYCVAADAISCERYADAVTLLAPFIGKTLAAYMRATKVRRWQPGGLRFVRLNGAVSYKQVRVTAPVHLEAIWPERQTLQEMLHEPYSQPLRTRRYGRVTMQNERGVRWYEYREQP